MRQLWTRLGPFATGVLGAMLGGLISLGLWHLWVDHQNLHALVRLVQQSQQQLSTSPQVTVQPPSPVVGEQKP